MKKILTFASIIMIGLVVFASCSKKSSGSSYTMSGKVGSTSFTANTCVAIKSGTALSINGFTGTSATTFPYMNITITNFTGTGTYTIDTTATFAAVDASFYSSGTDIKVSRTGSVTITASSSTSVSGNFTFTATDGTSMTSTSNFSAKY